MSRLIAILLLAATPALAQQPATPAPPAGKRRPRSRRPGRRRGRSGRRCNRPSSTATRRPSRSTRRRRPRSKLSSGEIDRLVPGRTRRSRKGENGVWTLTVAPLPPGIYDYTFDVDGVVDRRPVEPERRRQRPRRARLRRGARPRRLSRGTTSGADGARQRDRRTGTTRRRPARAAASTSTRRPATARRRRSYPVLYLLHGSGDNDSHWAALGRANVIADNLLADGKTEPMMIVMPDGHAYRPQQGEPRGREKALKTFEDDLLERRRAARREHLPRGDRTATPRHRRAVDGRRPVAQGRPRTPRSLRLDRRASALRQAASTQR